ncbi:MAG: protein kinase, partial [bacterium]|nr:protein kinase [bacterium]
MKNIIQRPLLRGDWIGGRYRVESYLGTGSIGSVYIVSDFLQENRIKALKFIPHRTLSDEDLHYLSKRIRILHKLNVRGILTALEQGADENGLYFTMEYLESPSLGSVSDTLSDYEITCLLYELSGILAQLHEFKFLHRRLHPNNLFLRVTNFHAPMHPQPIVTVTDAGLSLPHLLSHYSIFIAPELHEGGFHDIQTELYSFGILAYALYHRILNQTLQLQQIVQSHSTFVEWKNHQISKDISTLILRCINRDPKLRPFDFREVETTLYRNLQTKPSPKALPISSVFVGRGNEFRYFSIRLQDVQHQKQWAILIQGENESGKSRLMDEFAIEHQLKGKFAVRLDKENISPLLKLFPHHRAITLQSSDLFSYVSENLEKLLKEKVLPFPLLICWHNFDQLPEEGYLFFKQLLILKKDFPILWLLEGRNPIPNLDTLGHSERFNRYPLPPLQPKELEKFIGNYLHYASGYQSLTRQLVQYFGTKPGWLINALQILLEKKAITYELGRFHIHPLEIEKLLRSGQLSPAVDLTQLSPLAKTILQWMSVYRLPLTEDQLNSIFGIDDLELRNAMNLLTYKGYLVQSGIYYQFRLPAMMDSVFRTIPEYRLKQIYGWIAQWQERNFRDQPTALELWTIAKSYFAAGERNAFLRVFETLLERFGNKIDITFPEEILWSALQEKRSPLSLVNQFRTLRILYRQY